MCARVHPFPQGFKLGPTARFVHFAHLLRSNGYQVDSRALCDALTIAEEGDLFDQHAFRMNLRSLFCKSSDDLARFDEFFDAFWLGHIGRKRSIYREASRAAQTIVEKNKPETSGGPPSRAGALARYFEWREQNEHGGPEEAETASAASLGGASQAEARSQRDFGHITQWEEAEALLEQARLLGKKLRYKRSRRYIASKKGARTDLRKSLSTALLGEGIPAKLHRKVRRKPPLSFNIFVDVSGSMDSYSLFFVQFMQAFLSSTAKSEAFLFHTKLVHVSGVFREVRAQAFLDKIGLIGQGWSGGTRIGEAFASFHRHYARRFCHSRSVILIMSDGYDRSDPEILEQAMARLKNAAYRIVWLNPLFGRERYEAVTAGAKILSHYADLTLPCHNLASLEKIQGELAHV